jgi:hypothetical protein
VSGFGKGTERRRPRATPSAASSRSSLTALVVALSLLVPLVATPYHQALAGPGFAESETARIAAELKATFGDAAALCVEVDGKAAPISPAGHCDDQCPLCRFAAQAATLVAPDAPALPGPLDAACQTLGSASERGAVPCRLKSRNRARAPPLAV